MTHRLTTNYAKNYCNRTLIVKVIVENVVTCFLLGHGVECTVKNLFSPSPPWYWLLAPYHIFPLCRERNASRSDSVLVTNG